MKTDKKIEVKQEKAQPEQAPVNKPVVIVRSLVIQTDGNTASIKLNEMGLLELRSILQMLSNQVERDINALAQPAPAPPAPEESEDG